MDQNTIQLCDEVRFVQDIPLRVLEDGAWSPFHLAKDLKKWDASLEGMNIEEIKKMGLGARVCFRHPFSKEKDFSQLLRLQGLYHMLRGPRWELRPDDVWFKIMWWEGCKHVFPNIERDVRRTIANIRSPWQATERDVRLPY